ncbi:acyl carrier protein [Streptomyces sp. NPDC050619]|uniref:acyl carrier protein n=1 Tax=Streptomyces sp. NPDC050619 TaxID=3157214 RepID=UPI00341B8B4B
MEEEVLKIVREAIPGHPEIDMATPLLDLGLIDSLSIIEIVTRLEEHFAMQLPDHLMVPDVFSDVTSIASAVRITLGSAPGA